MYFDVIFKAFLVACGGSLLTLIIASIKWVVGKIKADKAKEEANEKTLKALMHDSYFRHCRYLLDADEITESELENHNLLYEAYHVQGLNGTGDRFNELVMEKPVKPS